MAEDCIIRIMQDPGQQYDPHEVPRMLTIREAAEVTGMSYYFIRQMCLTGQLKHFKSGKKTYISAHKLAEFLNSDDPVATRSIPAPIRR